VSRHPVSSAELARSSKASFALRVFSIDSNYTRKQNDAFRPTVRLDAGTS
jgi:hypothetical protein